MPAFDGTGPFGWGPMTGRGFGSCAGWGYGRGRGFGKGRGLGRLFGWGYSSTKQDRKEMLKDYQGALREELEDVEKELKDLQ